MFLLLWNCSLNPNSGVPTPRLYLIHKKILSFAYCSRSRTQNKQQKCWKWNWVGIKIRNFKWVLKELQLNSLYSNGNWRVLEYEGAVTLTLPISNNLSSRKQQSEWTNRERKENKTQKLNVSRTWLLLLLLAKKLNFWVSAFLLSLLFVGFSCPS